MKHLTIIVPDGQSNLSTIACLVGSYEIFRHANSHWKEVNGNEVFKIELAGVTNETDVYGLFSVKPHTHISRIEKTNLILIPSLSRDYEEALGGNQFVVDWIAKQYRNGAEIASMCTGAFMLAAAGLLDGKNCATHWSAANVFRTLYPGVNLKADQLITDEDGIYTNGGAYSFLNLVIYLVEKYFDRETAIYCSKIFQVEMDRQSQSAFSIFKGQKSHEDEMVKKAQAFMETNFQDKISVEELSLRFAVGRRSFDRRFVKATGNTPLEYLQRLKIESAKKAFETTRKNINEVMYEVGYSDVKAFREVFRKITGVSPLAYRAKYNAAGLHNSFIP